MKFKSLIALVLLAAVAVPVKAEFYGLSLGRTANNDNMSDLSVEAGLNLGATLLGLRVNYKLSPDLMFYGDLGRIDDTFYEGIVFGVGAYYQLRTMELIENTDLGVKVSYHGGTLDCEYLFITIDNCDKSASEIAVNAVVSGDQLGNSNMAWYGNAGLHVIDTGTTIGLGAGVVGNLSFGDWYIGLERTEDFYLAVGLRYNIN